MDFKFLTRPERDFLGSCRLVNDVLHIRESRKDSFGGHPVERPHGEIIILPLPDSELPGEVIEGIESMAGVEFFIVFSVAAFHLAIMPRCKGADLLVPDAELGQCFLKECQRPFLAVSHFVGKLKSVVCLDTLNGIRELFYHMLDKLGGRIGALLLEGFQIPKAAVLINESILIILFSRRIPNQTYTWNIFHIYLNSLSGILHLLIRFRNIFGVWKLDRLTIDPAQELVQTGDGSGIAPLPEFDPKYNQTGMWVPAAHIPNEGNFLFCMLIRVTVRAVRAVCKRTNRPIIFLPPAVDILSAGLVVDRGGCYAVFQRIFNYCLLKPHILCYLIHSG